MKFTLFIDDRHEEECIIYARERSRLVEEIERLIMEDAFEIMGYKDAEIVRLNPCEVYCFAVEGGKTYAITQDDKLLIKYRLYQLEEKLADSFVKINQSCIVSIRQIKRFDASLSGSLMVELKNGYSDYVSRRQLKRVKERLGV